MYYFYYNFIINYLIYYNNIIKFKLIKTNNFIILKNKMIKVCQNPNRLFEFNR